jgi:hypothetical protein
VATTTNFGWTTPDNTGYVKDGALAIRTLGSAIDTSLLDLKGGTTDQVLKKASGTDMDFVWGTVSSTPRIAQVVQGTTTSSTSTTNTSYVDCSGMSATITPTLSTSKVLVTVSYQIGVDGIVANTFPGGNTQLVRGSTAIWVDAGALSIYLFNPTSLTGGYMQHQHSYTYLDSPATTSATTYKLQIKKYAAGTSTSFNPSAITQTIVLQEVLV